jgi:hypothetical protein
MNGNLIMKKIFLLTIACMDIFYSSASGPGKKGRDELEQGTWMAGGNMVFSLRKEINALSFNPQLGYFFVDNLAAGVDVTYFFSGEVTASLGPFFRAYTRSGQLALFGQLRGTYNMYPFLPSSFGIAGGPGVDFFINDYIAVETLAEYHLPDLGGSGGEFNLQFRFQIYFPFR